MLYYREFIITSDIRPTGISITVKETPETLNQVMAIPEILLNIFYHRTCNKRICWINFRPICHKINIQFAVTPHHNAVGVTGNRHFPGIALRTRPDPQTNMFTVTFCCQAIIILKQAYILIKITAQNLMEFTVRRYAAGTDSKKTPVEWVSKIIVTPLQRYSHYFDPALITPRHTP